MKFFAVIFFALPFCACSWIHEESMIPLFLYAAMSLVTFVLYAIDKHAAKVNGEAEALAGIVAGNYGDHHADSHHQPDSHHHADSAGNNADAHHQPDFHDNRGMVAAKKSSRVPEKILHLCEFAFGFPGAILGQIALHHKSSKKPYQVVFWLIVVVHVAAWTWFFSLPEGTLLWRGGGNFGAVADFFGGTLRSAGLE